MTLRRSSAAVLRRRGQDDVARYGRWHTPDRPVSWGSVTKVFVAALARTLVARGVWSWDTTLAETANVDAPTSITIGGLVGHTSGLPRMLPAQSRQVLDPYRSWTNDVFDSTVLSHLGEWAQPAGSYLYSNVGYAVLTRAVEISQRQPWVGLLRSDVLEPLGVDAAAFGVEAGARNRHDVTRSRSLVGGRQWDWDVSTGPFSGAGGLCSTVPAMVAVLAASLDGGSALAPGPEPHAWGSAPPLHTVSGALLRCGSVVAVDVERGSVGVAHSVGGLGARGDVRAEAALAELVASVAERSR